MKSNSTYYFHTIGKHQMKIRFLGDLFLCIGHKKMQLKLNYLYNFDDRIILWFMGDGTFGCRGTNGCTTHPSLQSYVLMCKQKNGVYRNGNKADIQRSLSNLRNLEDYHLVLWESLTPTNSLFLFFGKSLIWVFPKNQKNSLPLFETNIQGR